MTALAIFCDEQLDISPIGSLPDGRLCDTCAEQPAVMRVYGSPEPAWVFPNPFVYAETCLDCGAVCASLAVVQRSDADLIVVELAADVYACRDDEGCC